MKCPVRRARMIICWWLFL